MSKTKTTAKTTDELLASIKNQTINSAVDQMDKIRMMYLEENLNLANLAGVKTSAEFEKMVEYFTDINHSHERQVQYESYAKEHGLLLNEAKNQILNQVFGNYILDTLTAANARVQEKEGSGQIKNQNNLDAYVLIKRLELLKPIFKHYDTNTFISFVSSVEKNISLMESDLLFGAHEGQQALLDDLKEGVIKALANGSVRVSDAKGFMKAFAQHPLLYCLGKANEVRQVNDWVAEGVLELGHYKNLVQALCGLKEQMNQEKIDFFVSYLIKEDIEKGFYNIYTGNVEKEDGGLAQKKVHQLITQLIEGTEVDLLQLEQTIDMVSEQRKTLRVNAEDQLEWVNHSLGTLNDSGLVVNLAEGAHFFHLHTAQGKGVGQAGQQATMSQSLMKARKSEKKQLVGSLSASLVAQSAGKMQYAKDQASQYGWHMGQFDQVMLSNLQFEADYLKVVHKQMLTEQRAKRVSGLGKTSAVANDSEYEGYIMTQNIRVIKDNIAMSMQYNQCNAGLSDKAWIKEHSALLAEFIKDHEEPLSKALKSAGSNNSFGAQLVGVPLLGSINSYLKLEALVGCLWTAEQTKVISELIDKLSVEGSNNVQINELVLDIQERLAERESSLDFQMPEGFMSEKSFAYDLIAQRSRLQEQELMASRQQELFNDEKQVEPLDKKISKKSIKEGTNQSSEGAFKKLNKEHSRARKEALRKTLVLSYTGSPQAKHVKEVLDKLDKKQAVVLNIANKSTGKNDATGWVYRVLSESYASSGQIKGSKKQQEDLAIINDILEYAALSKASVKVVNADSVQVLDKKLSKLKKLK